MSVKQLIQAGLHFGHAASSWNPKMAPYLFGKRKKVHIFDLKQTANSLVAAIHFVNQQAAQGRKGMFVGTKIQAQNIVKEVALATNSYYVNERWLGGMLTNHEVILRRLGRLAELEEIFNEENPDYSKKALSALKRECKKLQRDLGGVRGMESLPEFIVIIDPGHEHIAVNEANICHIPIVALTDSNCDPEPIDLMIPGNDDAIRAIELVLSRLRDAILEGQKAYEEKKREEAAREDEAEPAKENEGAEVTAEATSEESAAEPAGEDEKDKAVTVEAN